MLLNFDYLKYAFHLDIRGVLHIGAHYGQEYEIYQRHHIKNVVFFEPLEKNFKQLEKNILATETVKLIKNALGNQTAKVQMYVESANGGQSSSVLKPDIHLKQYPHITFDEVEMVQMVRLDDLMETLKPKNYNMINIDVQGYELEVFKGAEKYLNHIDYIICEVNRANVYHGCARVHEIDEYLGKFGFKRAETSWEGVTWGDAFYIKEKD